MAVGNIVTCSDGIRQPQLLVVLWMLELSLVLAWSLVNYMVRCLLIGIEIFLSCLIPRAVKVGSYDELVMCPLFWVPKMVPLFLYGLRQ